MKKLLLYPIAFFTVAAHASMLDLNSSSLTSAGTTSASYSTALSVQAKTGGDVLVIGTFSNSSSDKSGAGSWQLENGTQTSTAISRSLESKKDVGIASVAHIFTDVAKDSLINLQHATTSGGTLTTSGANLVAIPLTVSTGEKLNHELYQQGATEVSSVASSTFTETGIKTAVVNLDRASNNGVYMAATFNAKTLSTGGTGTWKLQFSFDGGDWTDTGSEMKRTMNTANDTGSVTLYALEEGLGQGTYEVRLVASSDNGTTTVQTLNGSLAAVALSYTNEVGGGYFDGFSVEANELSEVGSYDGAQASLSLENADSGIFSAMSFNSSAGTGKNQTGGFDLFMTNSASLEVASNKKNTRYFDDTQDLGSGASVGYFDDLASGDYTVFGRSENVTGPITTSNVTLTGFATEAIPEPAIITLCLLFGGGLLMARRIFSN